MLICAFLNGGDKIETTYKVGMYIRLSNEDDDKNFESESITNQRSFIIDYLKDNNYTLYDEYVDDGFSGTHFDRPAFKRMIADIESGKINMVVTKDMSRLGRDYINFGHYIEKYFPEHNVRYIAITDNVDTFLDCSGNDMVPFKAVFNDMYSKDISKKIKASLITKKKQGLFLGTYAPYGYRKDPNNKYKLIVDPVTSAVVKRIYKLFLEGYGLEKIAKILTGENIPRPNTYNNNGSNSKNILSVLNIWQPKSISQILKNPSYTGNLYQNKRKKVNYKSKKIVPVAPEKWIVSYNTHEPIIDKKTFDLVQNVHEKNKLHHKNTARNILLKGFMFCKECGHVIGINSTCKDRNYTICNYYKKYSKQKLCTSHSMRYEFLERIVLEDVREMCHRAIDTQRLEAILKNKKSKTKQINKIDNDILTLKNTIKDIFNHMHISYTDKLSGVISLEMYQETADSLSENISINKKLISELEKKREAITNNKALNNKEVQERVKEYLSIKEPNRALLASIIDKITVDKDKNIEIHYKIKPFGE